MTLAPASCSARTMLLADAPRRAGDEGRLAGQGTG